MKKVITLITLLGIAFAPAFSQVGTIKGKVVNSKEETLAGVEIVFTEDENEAFEQIVMTKDNGNFVLTGLKPGKHYKATFNLEGFNTQIYPFKQWIGVNEEPIVITLFTLEEAYEQQGGDLEALAHDQQAREFYNLAVGFFKAQKFTEAVDPITKAYENYSLIDKENELVAELAVIPRLYSIIAYNTEDYENSKTLAEEYLSYKPEDKNIQELLAATVKKLSGPSPQELYNQAIELINNNDDSGAAVLLEKAIKSDPEYGLSYFQLGKIKTREFEFEDAVKNFKIFVKLEPNHELSKEAKELIVTLSE